MGRSVHLISPEKRGRRSSCSIIILYILYDEIIRPMIEAKDIPDISKVDLVERVAARSKASYGFNRPLISKIEYNPDNKFKNEGLFPGGAEVRVFASGLFLNYKERMCLV
jgi:hypothetical protein